MLEKVIMEYMLPTFLLIILLFFILIVSMFLHNVYVESFYKYEISKNSQVYYTNQYTKNKDCIEFIGSKSNSFRTYKLEFCDDYYITTQE